VPRYGEFRIPAAARLPRVNDAIFAQRSSSKGTRSFDCGSAKRRAKRNPSLAFAQYDGGLFLISQRSQVVRATLNRPEPERFSSPKDAPATATALDRTIFPKRPVLMDKYSRIEPKAKTHLSRYQHFAQ
jgi:hypothetical protein